MMESNMTESLKFNDVGDVLYVRLREGRIAKTRTFGDDRLVDVDADGTVLGVEFIGLEHQLDLRGLPAEANLLSVIKEHAPPQIEVLTNLVRT